MKVMFRKIITILFAAAMMLGGSGLWMTGGSPAYAESGGSWVNVGESPLTGYRMTNIDMYVDAGTPYIAFPDVDAGNKITVMKYSGSAWSEVGSPRFSDGGVTSVNLVVYNDTPYVAYAEGKNVVVQYYDNDGWHKLPYAASFSMATTAVTMNVYNGNVYVGYSNPDRGLALDVKKYTNNQWEFIGAGHFTFQTTDAAFGFNSNGTLYMACRQANNSTVVVERFTGGNWEAVGSLNTPVGLTLNFSVAFDQNDIPYVAYRSLAGYKGTLLKYTGGSWTTVGTPPFSTPYVGALSLQMEVGTPYVAYADLNNDSNLVVVKYDDQGWSSVGTGPLTTNGTKEGVVVSISGGALYVSYIGKDFKPTVMKYPLGPLGPVTANAVNNTVGASPSTVTTGNLTALMASGDRQSAEGSSVGDERYIPIGWASDEPNQAGNFQLNGSIYTSMYTPAAAGNYTITATFQKQVWNGDSWENAVGQTDTKTTSVTVNAPPTYTIAPISNQTLASLALGYASGSQETKTVEIKNTGTAQLTGLSTTLSGDDSSKFDITQPLSATLNSGAPGTSFTVKAKDNLPGRTYTATVTVSATNMTDVVFTVTQVVNNPLKGDVNGDGFLTPADALYITKYINNKIQLTDVQKYILDMNNDNVVDEEDAKIIMQLYVGGNIE